jgi:hypothetical protein
MEYHDDTLLYSRDAMMVVIAFIVCVECAKEPEYRCENCDKVYKQESRYNAHIAVCGVSVGVGVGVGVGVVTVTGAATTVSASDFSELLRQNREMIDIMRKQQETIQMLVAGLAGGGGAGGVKMNIE